MPMKKLKSSVVVSISAFFVIFFIFCGFAIDFTLMLVARGQLQNAVEVAALGALDEYEEAKISARAQKLFGYSKVGALKNSKIGKISVETNPRAIMISASAPVQPYFLSALGIHIIEVQARSAAKVVKQTPSRYSSSALPVPPNHIQYKLDKPFLSRGRELFIKGISPDKPYRVFVALGDSDEEDVRWVEVTCSANDKNGGTWYSIDDDCNGVGNLGAAQYVRLSLKPQSPPNYYWDWEDFKVDEISVITSVKLVKSSDF